jgi:superfamily II DNA or RNA helicase
MTDIIIHHSDQIRARLECSGGIAYEVAEEFSFFVKGYKFMPTFKSGRWDGRIKMFDVRNRLFYRGLIPRLIEWCHANDYTIKIDADAKAGLRPQVAYDPTWLDNWAKYGKFKPKAYQITAINHSLKVNQTLLMSPTGSGKSYMMYMMVRYLLENTQEDILITVPTTSLVEQLYSDFADYAVDWNVDNYVTKIYSGKEKNTKHRVKISTWQSVYKLPQNWFARFGAYLCDEAHGADSKSISSIVDKMPEASVRVGLTGTLDGTKLHELEMLARFGGIFRATTTRDLMDSGDLATLDIRCLKIQYTDEEIKHVKLLDYQGEIDFLITNDRRNNILVNAALSEPKNVLMLFNFIDKHGTKLYEMLRSKAEKYNKKIYYIHGGIDVEDRENIRQLLEKYDNCILLASFGTFSTGINVKNLHTVIFCHPFQAKIKTLQSIGRTIRTAAGKDGATLIDIADDLVYKTKKGVEKINTTMKHFIERLKIYQSEKFTYKIINLS